MNPLNTRVTEKVRKTNKYRYDGEIEDYIDTVTRTFWVKRLWFWFPLRDQTISFRGSY